MDHNSQFNENSVRRALLVFGLLILTVFLNYYAFVSGQIIIGLGMVILAISSLLIGKPALLFIMILFVETAKLSLPNFPDAIRVSQILQALLVGWVILDISLAKKGRVASVYTKNDIWMIVFLLNIFLIMAVRGTGFRVFGGTTYGGAGYIMLALIILCYFASARIEMKERDVKQLIWLMLIASLIPPFVSLLIVRGGAAFYFLERYVQTYSANIIMELASDEGIVRLNVLAGISYALLPIAYVFCKRPRTRFALILLAIIFVSLTGFRSRIFRVGLLVFMLGMYYAKSRWRTFILFGMAGVALWGFLIVATPSLPPAVQRTVSIVPFVTVRDDIARRATGSTDWRVEMWRDYCIPNVPNYLWIGRGIAHDISGFAWLRAQWYVTAEFFYHMGGYHSGPFSLLLDYGLVGTVSFTLFFLFIIMDAWRITRRYAARKDSITTKYFVFLTVLMTFEFVNYYLIFGDVAASLPRMLLVAAQLRILRKNVVAEGGSEYVIEAEKSAPTNSMPTGNLLNPSTI